MILTCKQIKNMFWFIVPVRRTTGNLFFKLGIFSHKVDIFFLQVVILLKKEEEKNQTQTVTQFLTPSQNKGGTKVEQSMKLLNRYQGLLPWAAKIPH